MLEKKHYAPLILALFMPFCIAATMNTIFYCISYKFRTGSHGDEQTMANLSSLTNDDATEQQGIENSNQTFEYVNPH